MYPRRKQIDKSGYSDVMPVEYQGEQQHHSVGYNVQCSKAYGNNAVQACHKGLERVNSQSSYLEDAYAYGADDYSEQGHCDSLFQVISFHGAPPMVLKLREDIDNFGILQRIDVFFSFHVLFDNAANGIFKVGLEII